MAAEILKALIIANLAAAAAIILVLGLRAPFRRLLGASAAYGLWLAVPLTAVATLIPGLPRFVTLPPAPALGRVASAVAGPVLAPAAAVVPTSFDWSALILALWIAGALALGSIIAIRQRRALALLGRMTHQAGDPPEMFRSTGSDGPAIVGAVRPRIIIPADFERRFEAHERRVIIAHETEHLIRGDVAVNAFCAAMVCLNWFNPLIHVAVFAIRVDQELACDAAVVARYPFLRRTYGAALLKTQLAGVSLPLGCYWPGRSHQLIRERLQTLAQAQPSATRRVIGVGLIGGLVLSAAVSAWAANPRPVVIVPAAKPFWSPDGAQNMSINILRGNAAREMMLAQGPANGALAPAPKARVAAPPAAASVKPGEGGGPAPQPDVAGTVDCSKVNFPAGASPTFTNGSQSFSCVPPAAVPPCSAETVAAATPCVRASGTLADLVESSSPEVRAIALRMLEGAEPADAARVVTLRNLGAGRTLMLFDGVRLPPDPAAGETVATPQRTDIPPVRDYLLKTYSTPAAAAP